MAPLPLTKLVGLVIKAVTKPVAKRFKTEAANNDRFRGYVPRRAAQSLQCDVLSTPHLGSVAPVPLILPPRADWCWYLCSVPWSRKADAHHGVRLFALPACAAQSVVPCTPSLAMSTTS